MVSSEDIKIALLSNYRYKKQQIAADEVGFQLGQTDISSYLNGVLTEVEIKTSKSDLWNGEKRKSGKHECYTKPPSTLKYKEITPNYFFICVPEDLLPEAEKWVEATNKNYGILRYESNEKFCMRPEDRILVWRRAKRLHNETYPRSLELIARRLSSNNIVLKHSCKSAVEDCNKYYNELRILKNKQMELIQNNGNAKIFSE